MAERIFGLETEYAITGIKQEKAICRDTHMSRFLDVARRRFPNLPDTQSNGMFLANGSRLYGDAGLHPELATPECTNPWDAVRYVKAGDTIIEEILAQLESEAGDGTTVLCFRSNVDYVGHATWGCHESYLHRCDLQALPTHMVPHLVSRTIYTGAGGLDPLSTGVDFTLSPRAAYIDHVTSGDSTSNRGIFHTKNESLSSRGNHRLHILCGESLCSELAIWLKVGATALVVAMIEAGLEPGRGVELQQPVQALRTVSTDTQMRSMLELKGGGRASALQIQRHYLSKAEAHTGEPFMPPWAGEVCSRWSRMLDDLEHRPEKLHIMLDWAMKHALYARHAESRGMPWEVLRRWSHVARKLEGVFADIQRRTIVPPEYMLGPNSPILEKIAVLTPYLRENGLRWDGVETFLHSRRELAEIDARFGQLGQHGVFRSLDCTRVLEHHVEGVDDIAQATSTPPAGSRARIRGEAVRRLSGSGDRYVCTWSGIYDMRTTNFVDLSDPFASEEKWGSQDKRKTGNQSGQLPLPGAAGDLATFLRMRG